MEFCREQQAQKQRKMEGYKGCPKQQPKHGMSRKVPVPHHYAAGACIGTTTTTWLVGAFRL